MQTDSAFLQHLIGDLIIKIIFNF